MLPFDKLLKATWLQHPSLIKNKYLIWVVYRLKSMGNRYLRSIPHCLIDVLLHLRFSCSIQGWCCFIHQQNCGVSQYSSSDGDSLFLSSWYFSAHKSYVPFISLLILEDKLFSTCYFRCIFNRTFLSISIILYILSDAAFKERRLLIDKSKGFP